MKLVQIKLFSLVIGLISITLSAGYYSTINVKTESNSILHAPVPPSNDHCENAIQLTAGFAQSGTTQNADFDFPYCFQDENSHQVFFKYQNYHNTLVELEVEITASGVNQATNIEILLLSDCYGTVREGINEICDGFELFDISCVRPGEWIYFVIGSNDGEEGTFIINIDERINPVVNNNCQNASNIALAPCVWKTVSGDNTNACPENFSFGDCDFDDVPVIWYRFDAIGDFSIEVSNLTSDGDLILGFYEQGNCENPVPLADGSGCITSPTQFDVSSENDVFLIAVGSIGDPGPLSFDIKLDSRPLNDNPCINSSLPPMELTHDFTYTGSTCCAVGYNDDPTADFQNVHCQNEETDDDAVWFTYYPNQTNFDGIEVTVEFPDYGFHTVEVYSGDENAGCTGDLEFLISSCFGQKTTTRKALDIEEDELVYIKIATAEEDCSGFDIRVKEIFDCEVADEFEEIAEKQTLYPETDVDLTSIWYDCSTGCLDLSHPEDPLPADGNGCDFSQHPTVWYAIQTDDYAAQLFTTVTTNGSWTPIWSVYYGNDFDNLINAATGITPPCSIDDDSADLHQTATEDGWSTYYLAVSADPNAEPIDDPYFEVCAATIINVLVCMGDIDDNCEPDPFTVIKITDREYAALEPEVDPDIGFMGPFCPGEEVSVFISFFFDGTESGADWFAGFIPDFGHGWDIENHDFNENPAFAFSGGAGGDGVWREAFTDCEATIEENVPHLCTYFDQFGVLRLCNSLCEACVDCDEIGIEEGAVLPNGYFWSGDGSNAGCVEGSCRPGEQWGLGSVTSLIHWEFNLKVKEYGEINCQTYNDLHIDFQTFSDGGAGCWEDPIGECLIDRKQLGPKWEVNCNLLPETEVSFDTSYQEICSGDSLNLLFSVDPDEDVGLYLSFKDNPNVTGEKDRFFEDGIATLTDQLRLVDTICEPQTVYYYLRPMIAGYCSSQTKDTIEIVVHPRPRIIPDTINLYECFPIDTIFDLLNYLNCSDNLDSTEIIWREINGMHSDASNFIQYPGDFGFGYNSFEVQIENNLLCKNGLDTITIYNPAPIESNLSLVHESHENAKNGWAKPFPSGGYPPYKYLWSNGDSTNFYADLGAGTYSITITDMIGCTTIDTFQIFVQNCEELEINNVVNQPACPGMCNGSIEITGVSNGTPPYTYTWNNGISSTIIDSLCAGNYWVYISDYLGCDTFVEFELMEPAALISEITGIDESTELGQNGKAWVHVSGGTSPYSFSWNNGMATDTIQDLAPAWYYVTITDSNSCTVTDSIQIEACDCQIEIDFVQNNASCKGLCNGNITVSEIRNAELPVEYNWSTGDELPSIENLCANVYGLTITDNNGITYQHEFEVLNNFEIEIGEIEIQDITVNGPGSIVVFILDPGEYEFSWTWPDGQLSYDQSLTDLVEAGCYELIITHVESSCVIDTTICIDDLTYTEYPESPQGLSIYPNPVKDMLVIKYNIKDLPPAQIELLDKSGRKMNINVDQTSDVSLSIDMKEMVPGIYIIRFELDGKRFFKRIAVIK